MVKAKAPRNKTLELSPKEIALYASKAVKLSQKSNLTDVINRVIRQDTFKALDLLPDGCIDLMIVDPPYNLTKNFAHDLEAMADAIWDLLWGDAQPIDFDPEDGIN